MSYYLAKTLPITFDEAVARTIDALKQEGFGVLTEIDVKATLEKKLGKTPRPYLILGACNPALAHQALEADKGVGLLLPCNVCLWEEDGGTTVSAIRPDAMFSVVRNPAVEPIVQEAGTRLRRVIDSLEAR
mgnify:CR=1 FL=1